jgi:starch synthase
MTQKAKKILVVASEAVPFSKSGGMGDVCGALPKALRKLGHDARLVIPRYWSVNRDLFHANGRVLPMGVRMGIGEVWCGILEADFEGVPVYFIEHEGYFGRAGFYDDGIREYDDNAERFGFFSRACIQLCLTMGFQPDIIHSNDWQTALVPAYLKIWELGNPYFGRTSSVFTIHNIAYQGVFPSRSYPFLGLGEENFTESKFENYRRINFMKGAIFYADAVTTVSPTYAEEILRNPGASGLAPYLERRRADIYGVLNGADYEHWNPETDPLIPARYSAGDLGGKRICKKELQKEFLLGQDPDIPIIGVVTRFCHQKGFQLLVPIIESIVSQMRVQFVFLGNGEKWQEDFFGGLPARFSGRIGSWIGYQSRKAHLIQAGADFILMPSLYEPCGLNQIYGMRYGTLPIVRETGGLQDTVEQYHEAQGSGTGFKFFSPDSSALYNTIGWAVSTYYDRRNHIVNMQASAMRKRFTWEESARHYETVYEHALCRRESWK